MPDLRPLAGQPSKPERQAVHGKEEPALKGTFIAVLLLGAFIAGSWLGVFVLFIARN